MKGGGNRRNGESDKPKATADRKESEENSRPSITRTSVYRRVPVTTRRKLDRALLTRPKECATLDAILEQFKLSERFGITREALRTYARKIEQLIEPHLAGHLAAAVLGCMPTAYRNEVAAGSEIILISKVVQALTKKKGQGQGQLEAPDLLKLASALRAAGQRKPKSCNKGSSSRDGVRKTPEADKGNAKTDQKVLAETVRTVYGLDWPAGEP
jgi:hypothetical protein